MNAAVFVFVTFKSQENGDGTVQLCVEDENLYPQMGFEAAFVPDNMKPDIQGLDRMIVLPRRRS